MTGALGSGSTTRPPLSQPWARALPLLLGSAPQPLRSHPRAFQWSYQGCGPARQPAHRYSGDEFYFTTPEGGERYPMVVPRSAKIVAEDAEFVLYAVVVLKQAVQEFTNKAREKRWTVRALASG